MFWKGDHLGPALARISSGSGNDFEKNPAAAGKLRTEDGSQDVKALPMSRGRSDVA